MSKPYKVQDKYFLLAKEEGYRARSAYKLRGIQFKFELIKEGQKVLDLGAAPGSFMQIIRKYVGEDGLVVGVDLQKMEPFIHSNMRCFQGDIYETAGMIKALGPIGPYDVVTSDLAPKTSGIRDIDQTRSAELTEQAYVIACKLLKPGGHFLGKVFEGEDLPKLVKRMKRKFKEVSLYKPPACRDRSFETYIVAKNLR
jgi:23S rRNA (uridine2552-2'-O)-methyltransferase